MNTDRPEIEDFLFMEARLLDTGRFDAWLALFHENAVYWVPAGHDDIDPTQHVSIIHDDKAALAKRIARLQSGHAYAQDPASRVHRLISNVGLGEANDESRTLRVTCMMLLLELARHRQTIHSARCEFLLQRRDNTWQILGKKVNLLRNNEVLEATPFLL
ncbi:aromatic-ring-hydroxylating dioxygenase subunit beta [Caballeronia sp. LjRoot31]|uniref:aromatic-ring-hydroxylating dioxygenase subunit beta n=1 Tax=Caballeronia sp. LjRoot31 TaxID=3342324 RepID=UPI003ED09DCC